MNSFMEQGPLKQGIKVIKSDSKDINKCYNVIQRILKKMYQFPQKYYNNIIMITVS